MDDDTTASEVEEAVEVREEVPGEMLAIVTDEEDRPVLVNSDADVRVPNAEVSHSVFLWKIGGERFGKKDLEETLPYGIEDPEEAQREERLKKEKARMDEEEWCIKNLFETGGHSTRSGRKVCTPTYLWLCSAPLTQLGRTVM